MTEYNEPRIDPDLARLREKVRQATTPVPRKELEYEMLLANLGFWAHFIKLGFKFGPEERTALYKDLVGMQQCLSAKALNDALSKLEKATKEQADIDAQKSAIRRPSKYPTAMHDDGKNCVE